MSVAQDKIKRKTQQWRNDLDDGIFIQRITNTDHTDIKHIGISDENMINRVISKDAYSVTTFDNKDTTKDYIDNTLYYYMEDIVKWMDDENAERKTAFDLTFKDETIGHGFRYEHGAIKEYTTDTITVVLRKNAKSIYGFDIRTAYPNIENHNAKPTNRDLKEITKQTNIYKRANPVYQTYLEYCSNNPKIPAFYQPESGKFPAMISIDIKDGDKKHMIRITEDSYDCKFLTKNKNHETIQSEFTDIINKPHNHHNVLDYHYKQLHDALKQKYPTETQIADDLYTSIRKNSHEQYLERCKRRAERAANLAPQEQKQDKTPQLE